MTEHEDAKRDLEICKEIEGNFKKFMDEFFSKGAGEAYTDALNRPLSREAVGSYLLAQGVALIENNDIIDPETGEVLAKLVSIEKRGFTVEMLRAIDCVEVKGTVQI